jgi:hypothetical protein
MNGPTGATRPVHPGVGAGKQPLDLAELGVGLLELGGAAGKDVEAVVVADGHLVGEPAKIPGEGGDALGELDPQTAQLGQGTAGGGGMGVGTHGFAGFKGGFGGRPSVAIFTAIGGRLQCPVSIGSSPLISSLTSLACCLPVVLFSF